MQRPIVALALLVLVLRPTAAEAQGFPDRRQTLVDARATYPGELDQRQAGELLNRVAWALRGEGFGLLRKDGGNRCPVAGLSVAVACDWLVHMPSGTGCDVLGSGPDENAPGPSTPTWCSGEPFDRSRFVAPVEPGGGPPPPPPPGGSDLAPVLERLDKMIALLETLKADQSAQTEALRAALVELRGQIAGGIRIRWQ